MTKQSTQERLAQTKKALSEKCMRLAKVCHSRPKRAKLLRHAESYRQQAEQLARP